MDFGHASNCGSFIQQKVYHGRQRNKTRPPCAKIGENNLFPHHRVTKTVRSALFFFFVGTFVVAAPLIVLYTAGYRISFNNQRLHRSGVIAVSTIPRWANVDLNGTAQSGRTPLVLQSVDVGQHVVTLKKKGYHDVAIDVNVEANQTTYIHLPLFADSLASPLPSVPEEEPIAVDYRAAFVDNGANVEVRITRGGNTRLAGLLPQDRYNILLSAPDYVILANAHNELYIVNVTSEGVRAVGARATTFDYLATDHLLAFTDGLEVYTLDVATGVKTLVTRESDVRAVAWHPSGEAIIFAVGDTIRATSIDTFRTRPSTTLATDVRADSLQVDDSGRRLWFTTDDGKNAYVLPLVK